MSATAQSYEQIMLEDPQGHWEVFDGELRAKPPMSSGHHDASAYLGLQLMQQLDPTVYRVRINGGHVRRTEQNYFIPDVFVVPLSQIDPERRRRNLLEVHDRPLPLVVEAWSPSTGTYDLATKFAEYRKRGDAELWRLHPVDETVVVWRRRPDGDYDEALYRDGVVELFALPGVRIDLDALWRIVRS